MNIKPIRNDDDLRAAFKRLESVFQAKEGTPEADEMEILVTLSCAWSAGFTSDLSIRYHKCSTESSKLGQIGSFQQLLNKIGR